MSEKRIKNSEKRSLKQKAIAAAGIGALAFTLGACGEKDPVNADEKAGTVAAQQQETSEDDLINQEADNVTSEEDLANYEAGDHELTDNESGHESANSLQKLLEEASPKPSKDEIKKLIEENKKLFEAEGDHTQEEIDAFNSYQDTNKYSSELNIPEAVTESAAEMSETILYSEGVEGKAKYAKLMDQIEDPEKFEKLLEASDKERAEVAHDYLDAVLSLKKDHLLAISISTNPELPVAVENNPLSADKNDSVYDIETKRRGAVGLIDLGINPADGNYNDIMVSANVYALLMNKPESSSLNGESVTSYDPSAHKYNYLNVHPGHIKELTNTKESVTYVASGDTAQDESYIEARNIDGKYIFNQPNR